VYSHDSQPIIVYVSWFLQSRVLPNHDTRRQGSRRIAGCLAWDTNLLCTLIFVFSSVRSYGLDDWGVCPTASRPSLGPTLLLFSEYRGLFPRGVKLITFYSVHIFHISGILVSIHKLLYVPYTAYFLFRTIKNAPFMSSWFYFVTNFEQDFVMPKERDWFQIVEYWGRPCLSFQHYMTAVVVMKSTTVHYYK
jgi:hypothetical protein